MQINTHTKNVWYQSTELNSSFLITSPQNYLINLRNGCLCFFRLAALLFRFYLVGENWNQPRLCAFFKKISTAIQEHFIAKNI